MNFPIGSVRKNSIDCNRRHLVISTDTVINLYEKETNNFKIKLVGCYTTN